MGINPAIFAWSLMEQCRITAKSLPEPYPWDIMKESYNNLVQNGKVKAGSSTACILTLEKKTGILYSANLGDSGYLVFRFRNNPPEGYVDFSNGSESDSDKEEHSAAESASSTPRKGLELIHESKESQHYFNAPYQLAILPDSLSDIQKRLFMRDDPEKALRSSHGPLECGDIIILGTDGCFDNMFMEDIATVVMTELEDLFSDGSLFSMPSDPETEMEFRSIVAKRIQKTAEAMVKSAAGFALSQRPSPFAVESKLQSSVWDLSHDGGKIDDITVLTAIVVSKTSANSPIITTATEQSFLFE
jgi:protein phosphatase PTC7